MNQHALAQLKENLLRQPGRINAQTAAINLIARRHKCKRAEAKKRFEELRSTNSYSEIFRQVMPREYQAALSSRVEIETLFIRALGFPIVSDWMEEMLGDGESPLNFSIPIYPMHPYTQEDFYEFETIPASYQLALILDRPKGGYLTIDTQEDQQYWDFISSTYEVPATLRPTGRIDTKIFYAIYKRQRSPLRYFPLLLDTINYNTKSAFFNFNMEMEVDIPWSADNVIWLRKEHKTGLVIHHQIMELSKWLGAKPKERVPLALKLYQKVRRLTDETSTIQD